MGVCWTMVWWRIAAETPASAPRCSAAERAYIEHALAIEQAATKKAEAAEAKGQGGEELRGRKLVWIILTSPPVLAMCVAHTAADWGSYILQDGLPGYLRDVLGFSLTKAGVFSSLPTLLVISTASVSAYVADWLRQGRMSTAGVRKLMTAMAFTPASSLLFALGLGIPPSHLAPPRMKSSKRDSWRQVWSRRRRRCWCA